MKINQAAFEQLSESANLSHVKNEDTSVRRNTSVYDIPMSWINAIKKNNVSVSSFIKQAIFEKLKRDGSI